MASPHPTDTEPRSSTEIRCRLGPTEPLLFGASVGGLAWWLATHQVGVRGWLPLGAALLGAIGLLAAWMVTTIHARRVGRPWSRYVISDDGVSGVDVFGSFACTWNEIASVTEPANPYGLSSSWWEPFSLLDRRGQELYRFTRRPNGMSFRDLHAEVLEHVEGSRASS